MILVFSARIMDGLGAYKYIINNSNIKLDFDFISIFVLDCCTSYVSGDQFDTNSFFFLFNTLMHLTLKWVRWYPLNYKLMVQLVI